MSFALRVALTVLFSAVTGLALRVTLLELSPGKRILAQTAIALIWAILIFTVTELVFPTGTT